jgi:hypothetical protein
LLIRRRKKLKAARISVICLLTIIILGASLSLVGANVPPPTATSGSVWTSNVNNPNVHVNSFVVGQSIYIFWSTELNGVTGGTVNIAIYNVDTDAEVYVFPGGPFTLNEQPKIWVPTEPGTYQIVLNGKFLTRPVAVATVLVAPESVFGALSAVGAGVAAFGAFAVIKKRKSSILPF